MSATPRPARPTALWSFFCTAGPMTSTAYVDVAPLLASAGYRVIVPYLRGYGTTRFLSDATPRNGQPSAVAVDMIALMDALNIEKATIAGYDWGARTANIVAALWPERCKAHGVRERLSDRQPGSRQDAIAAEGRARMVVSVLFRHRTRPVGLREISARISQSSSGSSRRRSGPSTTPRSIAARRRSTIRTMSPSSSTTTAGDSAWLKANRSSTI